jgi:glycosyltransferase involved in cell wall biosynthesis
LIDLQKQNVSRELMTTQLTRQPIDISVVMPVMNERDNIAVLLPRLKAAFQREGLGYELLVVDGNSKDGSREVAEAFGARVMAERKRGYAGALKTGVARGVWRLHSNLGRRSLPRSVFHQSDVASADPWRHRDRFALCARRGYLHWLDEKETQRYP